LKFRFQVQSIFAFLDPMLCCPTFVAKLHHIIAILVEAAARSAALRITKLNLLFATILTGQIRPASRYFKGSDFAAYCKMTDQPLL